MIYDWLIEALLMFLLAFTPLAFGAVHPWSIAVFEMSAAIMAFLWILRMSSSNKIKISFSPAFLLFIILIFFASLQLIVSNLTAHNLQLTTICPWATKTELLKLIAYLLIFLVTLNTIKTKRQIVRILSVIITLGFLMSLFYLVRYFGVPAPVGFINPDHSSAYFGMIIPLSIGLIIYVNAGKIEAVPEEVCPYFLKQPHFDFGPRPMLFFTIIVMGGALFFTMSRGGMFSFVAALLFIALLTSTRRSMKDKGWLILAIAVFIVLIIAWLGATPVVERILSFKAEITSRYYGGRLPIWQGTFGIIKDNPIFGTGIGTFNYIFPKYQPVEIIAKHYTYAHSDFLELLSEIGIAGFTLFVICGIWVAIYLFRRFRERHDPWVTGLSVCAFGSLASIFIHSFTDFNLHIPANAVLLSVILALFVSILNTTNEVISCNTSTIRYLFALLAIGLLIVYTISVALPAIADHYANKIGAVPASDWKIGTVPEGDCPYFRSINLDPSNAKYHYKLGRLYGRSKAYDLQLREYRAAVSLNPTNSQYHQSLAWYYGQFYNLFRSKNLPVAGNYKQSAEQEFQAAIAFAPNNAYTHRAFALWLLGCQDKESISRGIKEYKAAIALKPALAKEFLKKYGK